MKARERYDENGWLKEEFLWPLRQQIILDSLYLSDYKNDFGIAAKKARDFFEAYSSFITELAKEDGIYEEAERFLASLPENDSRRTRVYPVYEIVDGWIGERYDNEENLLRWYRCYSDESGNPLPLRYINVDIYWTFARSIQVPAKDEYEAHDIVFEMMGKDEIPQSSFEATGDWELDLSYQPEEEQL